MPEAMSEVRFGRPLHSSGVSAWQTLSSDVGDVQRPCSTRENSNNILMHFSGASFRNYQECCGSTNQGFGH